MLLYLSGAITSDPDYKLKFAEAALQLEKCGFDVVTPVEIHPECTPALQVGEVYLPTNCVGILDSTGHMHHDWHFYMRLAIIEMLKCDAVCALPDAALSRGARVEIALAGVLDMPVRTLEDWIREGDPEL